MTQEMRSIKEIEEKKVKLKQDIKFYRYGRLTPIPVEQLLRDEIEESGNDDILIQINKKFGIKEFDWKKTSEYLKKRFGGNSGVLWVASTKNRAIMYALSASEAEEFEELLEKSKKTEAEQMKLNEIMSLYKDEVNTISMPKDAVLLAEDHDNGYLFLIPMK
jgi:hypothetical protein